ncbi:MULTISPECIES: transketolase [unclassified Oceanispirochaeta]|uniref:transketolase n=1 Tax=unclassified Oceanispirochaeta TaxID=2635722 RepID=UPI000E094146|nr:MULTISPECIES: transketolase [unclassified Oceanispirochaeta]MBF9018199.1 transketolase [Oceanispirochaeta sp. M2]NPD74695.1 transketolase [Oceanispirochaeta sp. M1]RDG29487.1 transketolase [Oceanispirochaeta sp. M1]
MPLDKDDFQMLEQKSRELRKLIIDTVVWAGSGHVGGALSSIDMMTLLYHKVMKIDPERPEWEDRDRFILSKGHIGVGLAPVLADKGYFPKEWLETYNHTHSLLGMHLDKHKVPGLDASTGSLGHGLPLSLGLALSARLKKQDFKTYCLMGDGECDEGSVWEAAMAISHYKATNVVAIVDRNRCMIDGETKDVMTLEPFADKWRAFGFNVIEANGHDMNELYDAIEAAHKETEKPSVIIMNTLKGCGVDFMSGNYKYHYAGFDAERAEHCKKEIDRYHDERMNA